MTFESKHISISIHRPTDEVYTFAVDPTNLPKWAAGLSGSIELIDGEWIAASPMGRVKVKFAPRNDFGILDHEVTIESGQTFYNPMRVIRNQSGCEVVFTLYRQPSMSDEDFAKDQAMIQADLQTLKRLLETRP